MDSISLKSTSFILRSIPSTSISGEVPFQEALPRIKMVAAFSPGIPVELIATTPFSFPCKASDTLVRLPPFNKSSPLVVEMDATVDAFF